VISTAAWPGGGAAGSVKVNVSGLAGCRPPSDNATPAPTSVVSAARSAGGRVVVADAVSTVPFGATPLPACTVNPGMRRFTPDGPTVADAFAAAVAEPATTRGPAVTTATARTARATTRIHIRW
jgi:hypothetical protein